MIRNNPTHITPSPSETPLPTSPHHSPRTNPPALPLTTHAQPPHHHNTHLPSRTNYYASPLHPRHVAFPRSPTPNQPSPHSSPTTYHHLNWLQEREWRDYERQSTSTFHNTHASPQDQLSSPSPSASPINSPYNHTLSHNHHSHSPPAPVSQPIHAQQATTLLFEPEPDISNTATDSTTAPQSPPKKKQCCSLN